MSKSWPIVKLGDELTPVSRPVTIHGLKRAENEGEQGLPGQVVPATGGDGSSQPLLF
jgi:hypothetical protein